jgi:hypothetical protein
MATRQEMLTREQLAASVEREQQLTRLANRLVDAIDGDCQGDLGEMALVFSHALASVLRSWPGGTGRQGLVTAGRLLHRTLWASCEDGLGYAGAVPPQSTSAPAAE